MVELVDLSQTRVRLELSASPSLSQAQLEWLTFEAPATAIWQDGRLCFEEPLPTAWVAAT